MRILFLGAFLFLLSSVRGCHSCQGKKKIDPIRKKRETRDLEDLSDFFTTCMKRKSGMRFVSWRSVVDVSVRDLIWYKVVDEEKCAAQNRQDTVNCWQGRMDMLVDQSSLLLGPVRECVLEYGTRSIKGGFGKKRKRRSIFKNAPYNNNWTGKCPGATIEEYDECMENQTALIQDPPEYFRKLHLPSINKFLVEDISRCRYKSVVEPWNQGVVTHRRECRAHQYLDKLGNRAPDARWQCLPQIYEEQLRMDSLLRGPVKICNDKFKNKTFRAARVNKYRNNNNNSNNMQYRNIHYNVNIHLEGLVGYCPPDAVWTSWFNNNLTDPVDGDEESFDKLSKAFPDEYTCTRPSGVQIQVANSSVAFHLAGNNLAEQAPERGVKCVDAHQQPGRVCHDFKVRFCCLATPMPTPSTGKTNQVRRYTEGDLTRKHGDVTGVCGEADEWTPWSNSNDPKDSGNEYETFNNFLDANRYEWGDCEPVAIQARIAATNQSYEVALNNLKENHPKKGIVCTRDMQPIERPCVDFKVRFCCKDFVKIRAQLQKSRPRRSTAP